MKYRIVYKLRKDKDWTIPLADLQYEYEYGMERLKSLQETFGDWKVEFKLVEIGD